MWFIRSLNQNNEPQSMHPEENGAVADRFAKQSSEDRCGGIAALQSKVLND